MNDLLAVLGVKIDPSQAKAGANAVNRHLNSMSSRAKATATAMRTSLNSVGGAIAKLGGLLGGLSLGILAKGAINEFKSFEQGMKNVAAVAGATDAQLKALTKTALNLARATKFTPKEATDGLYSLASAGLNAEQQIAALPNVLNLAQAAQAGLGQTTEVTVALMNNFGLGASDTGRIVDVLTASIGASSQNMDRLMTSLRNGGPTAAAFGQDMEESIAAINILTTSFGNGELAGTGFAAVLRLMADKGEEFGITVKDNAGNLLPLIDIIKKMEEAGITSARAIEVFGARGGPALALLLKQGSAAIEDMTKKIQSNGQAAKVASDQMDTLQGDLDQLKSAYDVLQITLAGSQSGGLRKLVQATTAWVNNLTDNLPKVYAELEILANEWSKVSGLIVEGLGIMQKAVTDFLELEPSEGSLFGKFFKAIQEMPVNMRAAIDIMVAHWNYWDGRYETSLQGMRNIYKNAWDFISKSWELTLLEMEEYWAKFYDMISRSIAELLEMLGKGFAMIPTDTFQEWSEDLKSAAAEMRNNATYAKEVKKEINDLNKKREEERKLFEKKQKALKDEIKLLKKRRDDAIAAAFAQRDASLQEQQAIRDTAAALIEEKEILEEIIVTQERMKTEATKAAEQRTKEQIKAAEDAADYWEAHAEKMAEAIQEEKRLWDSLMSHMDAGDIKNVLAEAIKAGFEKGAKAGFDLLKKAWKENKAGFVAGTANLLTEFTERNREYNAPNELGLDPYGGSSDGTLRALADTFLPIVAMAGPWGAAIAAVVGLVDSISGGKLFGTAYELKESGFTAGLDAAGTYGDQYTKEEREKSFFRGTKTRITVTELNQDVIDAIEDLFDAIGVAMLQTARALGTEIPERVAGEFEQKFDANGNVTSSMSKVLGKTYEESFEDFAKRLTAENILAVIAQQFGDVETTQLQAAAWNDNPYDWRDGAATRPDQFNEVTVMMNEVQAIAERWRHDAGLLLEGSEMLLLVAADLRTGFNLLNDASLTGLTDFVEEMNFEGETLGETYRRLNISFRLLDQALAMTGVNLDLAREDLVKFAADITEAAGGIEAVANLWGSYLTNYFTESEAAVYALELVNDEIGRLTDTLGVGGITFENFRDRFQQALPDLTATEVVDWLRLGDALARAHSYANNWADSLTESLDRLMSAEEDFLLSQESLETQLMRNRFEIYELIRTWDDSIESQETLMRLIGDRYEMELLMLQMVADAIKDITETTESAVESIKVGNMSEQEQYDYWTKKAWDTAAQIPYLDDVNAVRQAVDDATLYAMNAYNVLDPSIQQQNAEGFITFLESTAQAGIDRINEIGAEAIGDNESLADKISTVMDISAQKHQAAADQMMSAASNMQGAAETMHSAAMAIPRTINSNVTVRVVQQAVGGYDTGGL